MNRPRVKRHKQSRHRQLEPLISTRREDGLWQSIERDEGDLASHLGNHDVVPVDEVPLAIKEEDVSDQDTIQHVPQHHRDSFKLRATGNTETSCAPSAQDTNPIKEETAIVENHSSTSSRADVLAWVSVSPPQHPIPPIPDQPQEATRRRRGRPRKSRNAPNWNRPRRVRFSDPTPPVDPGPQPQSRDTHVFVRLLKIIVAADSVHTSLQQRQELVWNNRAKGWRLAGERSERNIGDVGELFDDLPRNGSHLRVVLAPTVQEGAREPVEAAWNASRCCFQGFSQDVGSLAVLVALGEMKDMVKDPWARQFVAYTLS